MAFKKAGGLGGGLFANKMIYITPASLDGLTKKGGGGGSGSWKEIRLGGEGGQSKI